jgi:hypothetical protein
MNKRTPFATHVAMLPAQATTIWCQQGTRQHKRAFGFRAAPCLPLYKTGAMQLVVLLLRSCHWFLTTAGLPIATSTMT